MLIQKKELSKIGRGAPGAPRVDVDASVCARVTMEPTYRAIKIQTQSEM